MNRELAIVVTATFGLTLGAHADLTTSPGTVIAAFDMYGHTTGAGVESGDVAHTDGLQMNGWATGPTGGAWASLPQNGGGTSQVQGTSNGHTFTWNVGGAAETWAWTGSATPGVRNDYYYINVGGGRYAGAVPWRIDGLTPGGSYDLIMYGTARSPMTSTAQFAIPGFDAGSGPGNPVTLDAEGDGNFLGVVADASGYISGTFDAPADSIEARVTGVQIAELAGPPPL